MFHDADAQEITRAAAQPIRELDIADDCVGSPEGRSARTRIGGRSQQFPASPAARTEWLDHQADKYRIADREPRALSTSRRSPENGGQVESPRALMKLLPLQPRSG
jgi:hypothetical protein